MIKKIISGGQTGADQAELDVALMFSVANGGWMPKGRNTEVGNLPGKYPVAGNANCKLHKTNQEEGQGLGRNCHFFPWQIDRWF